MPYCKTENKHGYEVSGVFEEGVAKFVKANENRDDDAATLARCRLGVRLGTW